MAVIDAKARRITWKVVYYGPGLGGKTTNLKVIHSKSNPKQRGKLLSLETESERTLFFDFFPLAGGKLLGMDTRFSFYTVPGQSFYNLTRRTILKDVDGVVFVGDSQAHRIEATIDSYYNLEENLQEHKMELAKLPHVIQYNKRDLPGVVSVAEMRRELNIHEVPDFEAVATKGEGVFETLRKVVDLVMAKTKKELSR
jgi:signal recognition particle receptor subunit beta